MSPIAAVLFMTGVIALLGGAGRLVVAYHAGSLQRPTLPAAAWLGLSLYGLILASVGIVIGR
ncbi:MAG: hypothetical protein ACTS8Z_03640 [Candidatus Limnocylindrales bacterium]